jgi:hypothetical protein
MLAISKEESYSEENNRDYCFSANWPVRGIENVQCGGCDDEE